MAPSPMNRGLGRRARPGPSHNVLAIALANKLARIAWSVLHHGRNFEVRKISESVSQPA